MSSRKSDSCIVAQKPVSQTDGTKLGNASEAKAARLFQGFSRTPPILSDGLSAVLKRLERITLRAQRLPGETFNNLFSLLNVDLLREAFGKLKRRKAAGVDRVTVEDYEERLEENLNVLCQGLHRLSYRPQASLRKLIPKGNGKTRPLGIATVEDKIVQRAIVMILERIYEVDFCNSSFGFRPKLSCHDALSLLGQQIATKKVNWISDADIKGFFDNVSHSKLLELLQKRIQDTRMLKLITRFLKAGVMIDGNRESTEEGVAQGSVLSPLLANIYLHEVLDLWFEKEVKPRLKGEAYLVRYADDFICGFEREDDAKRFQSVLKQRLARFDLELAEEKTKLIRFGRFAKAECKRQNENGPQTFDFLGFTHYCGQSRAGKFKLKRKTATKKLRGKLKEMKEWFRTQLSTPIKEVWGKMNQKLQGHYQYYGVNDNWPSLIKYQRSTTRMAYKWMCRRSQKGWITFQEFLKYVSRNEVATPIHLEDLIARGYRMVR